MVCLSVIDSGTINTFKNGLNTLKKNRIGFFMDQPVRLAHCMASSALMDFCRAGAAAPGELPGEL